MELKRLGERIIWARELKGWSAADLVRESGVPQGTISKMEKHKQNTLGKYGIQLQKALGVSFEWLATGEGDPFHKNCDSNATDIAYSDSMDTLPQDGGRDKNHIYVESYEYWSGDVASEIRFMSVPISWLKNEGYSSDQIKSIEMPDESQSGLVNQGFEIAINIEWGSKPLDNLYYALEIGGRITLRRIEYQYNGDLILRCLNEKFNDQRVSEAEIKDLRIVGVAVKFQGSFPKSR